MDRSPNARLYGTKPPGLPILSFPNRAFGSGHWRFRSLAVIRPNGHKRISDGAFLDAVAVTVSALRVVFRT